MSEQKKELISRFNRIQKLIPDTIQALSDLPDNGDLFVNLDPGKLRVILDYDIPEYKKYRKEMGKSWLFQEQHFNELIGCYHVYFIHTTFKVKLTIDLQISKDNNSCKLVVDHYRQAEPVYRLECK